MNGNVSPVLGKSAAHGNVGFLMPLQKPKAWTWNNVEV